MSRHNIWIPEWDEIQRAAREASVERGEDVSASQWIREACAEKRERDQKKEAPR